MGVTTIADLQNAIRADEEAIYHLEERLSHATSYTDKQGLLARMRVLNDKLVALETAYLRRLNTKASPVTVYGTTKKPRTRAGLSVTMDISTDGFYFSNPAPAIAHGQHIWVRVKADIAQRSPFATKKTEIPELIRLTWVKPGSYASLDRYSSLGRIEYLVSIPLIVTREFQAPSTGSTKANFGCYVDPYYPIEDFATPPPSTAPVELTKTTMSVAAGTYTLYTLISNALSGTVGWTTPAVDVLVAENDESFILTSTGGYLSVRGILSGSQAGKYIISGQPGISINAEAGTIV